MRLCKQQITKIIKEIKIRRGEKIVFISVTWNPDFKDSDPDYLKAIYRVDKDYKIIWQVNDPDVEKGRYNGDPFIDMCRRFLSKNIFARRSRGHNFLIDPDTGEANYLDYSK